ncbi:MAG: hypothetical protein PHH77_11020 [Victivallaceae bacterium]|nr:hypothetical protein [Victivallaceae bacterium]
MNKWLALLLLLWGGQLEAAVKVENLYYNKEFAGYLVSTRFFKTVLVMPNRLDLDRSDADVIRGGWFKSIVLKDSVNLLGEGLAPDGTMQYGLTQLFEPLVELPKKPKELVLPGIGRGTIDDKAALRITEFFPWRSTVTGEGQNKENIRISFLQDCDNSKKEINYKMRIDCVFSDTALVEIKGIFFNLSDKILKARVSPAAIFNHSQPGLSPWIVVPYQKSRVIDQKRITYIDSSLTPINNLRNHHEFVRDRLSKAKRWIAIGGLAQQGVFALISPAVIEKAVFWKTAKCFSVFPYINLEAKPKQRVEWTWKLIVGRGMDAVSDVAENGLLGIALKKYADGKRYKCEIQFMPVRSADDMVMDVLLRSARGAVLSTKSYEMFKSSPLHPEIIVMKLPPRVSAQERYSLKLELYKNDTAFLKVDQWLFPE